MQSFDDDFAKMLELDAFGAFSKLKTPFYYYDTALLRRTADFVAAEAARYGITVHYAVKANSSGKIIREFVSRGFGADCVSGAEVLLADSCGVPAEKIFFAGVGKSDAEISDALRIGIGAFNCESLQEMEVIDDMAAGLGVKARVALRINPDVDAHTHRYITTGLSENKFGIYSHEFDRAIELLKTSERLEFVGLQFHIGSQITDIENVIRAECGKINGITEHFESRGLLVRSIDLGGGLGVDYEDPDGNPVPDFTAWFRTIGECLRRRPDQIVHVEPGRAMVAQCGTLVSRVLFVKCGKTRNFLVLDAGMNDLIRPALYGAYHKIENLSAYYERGSDVRDCAYDVVGPVCESSDVFGEHRILRRSYRGDLIAIRSAGAYGSAMSSRYNLRPPAPDVFSDEIVNFANL